MNYEIKDAINNIDSYNNSLEYNQKYNVTIPEPEEQLLLKKALIIKIKNECKKVKKNNIPLDDIFISLSTLFLGGSLGAVASFMPYEYTLISVLFYTIFPALGVGLFIAYLFNKKRENDRIYNLAEKINEYLADVIESEKEDE